MTTTNALPLRDCSILVVEDEFLIAIEMECLLRDAGANIIGPFMDLSLAYDAARNDTLSAAILDFRIGGSTSQRLAEILTERSIPFLFYTGQKLPSELHSLPIVPKPANGETIIKAVHSLLTTRVEAPACG